MDYDQSMPLLRPLAISASVQLRLRPMQESDAVVVANLIARAMNADEAAQAAMTFTFHFGCRKQGLCDGRTHFVYVLHSTPIGITGLHHYIWGPKENVWLGWFAVDPAHQGQGIGSKLMDLAIQQAREAGYRKLFVETYSTPDFAKARHFYAKQGFKAAGAVTAYLPKGGDMLVLERDL